MFKYLEGNFEKNILTHLLSNYKLWYKNSFRQPSRADLQRGDSGTPKKGMLILIFQLQNELITNNGYISTFKYVIKLYEPKCKLYLDW